MENRMTTLLLPSPAVNPPPPPSVARLWNLSIDCETPIAEAELVEIVTRGLALRGHVATIPQATPMDSIRALYGAPVFVEPWDREGATVADVDGDEHDPGAAREQFTAAAREAHARGAI